MSLKIKVLKANHGDAIVVESHVGDDTFRILIDSGPGECFENVQGPISTPGPLRELLDGMIDRGESFDLTILTHVDDDHIGGLLKACEHEHYRGILLKNVWFNSGKLMAAAFGFDQAPPESDITIPDISSVKTSIKQGVSLDALLDMHSMSKRKLIMAGDEHDFPHGTITVLSPTRAQLERLLRKWEKEDPSLKTSASKTDYDYSLDELCANDLFEEDSSVHNASSIAILLKTHEAKVIFLADSYPSTICRTLREKVGVCETEPLAVDVCKISHHGSKANTNDELLTLLRCNQYIVSTNGSKHGLPNKRTLARIRKYSPTSEILFNYDHVKALVFPNKNERDQALNMKYIEGDLLL